MTLILRQNPFKNRRFLTKFNESIPNLPLGNILLIEGPREGPAEEPKGTPTPIQGSKGGKFRAQRESPMRAQRGVH